MGPGGVNDIGLNREIVVQKLGWARRICQNPANFRCRQQHELGFIFAEKAIHSFPFTQIKLGMAANQHIAATKRFESADDRGSDQSSMPGDKYSSSLR